VKRETFAARLSGHEKFQLCRLVLRQCERLSLTDRTERLFSDHVGLSSYSRNAAEDFRMDSQPALDSIAPEDHRRRDKLAIAVPGLGERDSLTSEVLSKAAACSGRLASVCNAVTLCPGPHSVECCAFAGRTNLCGLALAATVL